MELLLVAAAHLEDASHRHTLVRKLHNRDVRDVNETRGEDEIDLVLLV